MKLFRLAASGLLMSAFVVGTVHVSTTLRSAPPEVPCTTGVLAAPFAGPLHLRSIDGFGCEGRWAYTWATVGTGLHTVGVTELLRYNTAQQLWQFASRQIDCNARILPMVVYRQGCFSN
jgi:hypothetical protein